MAWANIEDKRDYQRAWMGRKITERRAAGLCKVNGCGEKHCDTSKMYCARHLSLKRADDKAYRERKKVQNDPLN